VNPMDERRRAERKLTSFFAEISNLDTGKAIGHLADISSGGLMILGDSQLSVGEQLKLRIELPRSVGPLNFADVTVEVRWSQPDLDPGSFVSGLEFRRHQAPSADIIERLRRVLGSAD